MSSATADTLGLSRAILCNDSLLKRLQDLKRTETMYRGLVEHTRRLLRCYYDLCQVYKGEPLTILVSWQEDEFHGYMTPSMVCINKQPSAIIF